MDETVILYDNKKRVGFIVFGILIVAALAFVYYMVFLFGRISISYIISF